MVVRFVPVGEAPEARPERDNIAEVIDLRSRLVGHESAPDEVGIEAARTGEARPEDPPAPRRDLREDAVRTLGRRALSAQELRAKLLVLGHPEHDVDAVIDDFIESCYLDDTSLARSLSEKLRGTKRASRAQIRRELVRRGIAQESIETVLSEIEDEDEDELLWEVARDRARRLTSLDRATAERRLLGFLARRGWTGSRVTRAASAVLTEALGDAR